MSGNRTSAASQVLVIGRDPDVLALVTGEVAASGITVTGALAADAEALTEATFDLIAFGSGVPSTQRNRLEQQFRAANPGARFIRTYAPYAASQIATAINFPASAPAVDLPAYCKRIGYGGPLEPTLDVLRALHELHIAAIPFEAIDVLHGRGVDLSPDIVDAKLLTGRRGGYCFEQNGLFKRVLTAIGFEVDALVASVRWMAPPAAPPPPRTHMVLRVTIDGASWLSDVGFGASVPPAPLRIDEREPQATRHGPYRIMPLGGGFLVQAEVEGRWQSLYDFSAEPLLDSHYELPNWFTSTHPTSHFRHHLIVAKTTPEARFALLDARLTIRATDGGFERRYLDPGELQDVIQNMFAIRVELEPHILQQLASPPAGP